MGTAHVARDFGFEKRAIAHSCDLQTQNIKDSVVYSCGRTIMAWHNEHGCGGWNEDNISRCVQGELSRDHGRGQGQARDRRDYPTRPACSEARTRQHRPG